MVLKRTLSIFLAVLMIGMTLTAFPITVNAADVDTAATAVNKTFTVTNANELSAAISEINAVTQPTTYAIDLQTDLENVGISITNGNAEVTIIGNGHTLNAYSQCVYVENGAKVNLGDGNSELTIASNDVLYDGPGLVYVLPGSTCNMYDKVTLKDHRGDNYFGGGVTIKGGTFHMYGGTIENCGIDGGSVCYGGGVAVIAEGKFIMDDGIITKCYAHSEYIDDYDTKHCYAGMGGGVFVTAGSSFTMNGGTISECEATHMGGGVAMAISESMSAEDEWDIYKIGNPKSYVNIKNGSIVKNKAQMGAGVFASGYYCAFSSSFEWHPTGTGLAEEPGLYISNSIIKNNEAQNVGGGVLVAGIKDSASVNIKNTDISNNEATSGAGICVNKYWTKALIDNCQINDNTASSLGGGIYLEDNRDNGAGTTVKNTVVERNIAGEKGGGVYYTKGSVLNIEGSDTIQSNTVDEKDNNLYFQGTEHPVNVTGSLEGSKIGITDARLFEDNMEDYDPEAQSSLRLTEGFKAQNPSLVPETAFTSDHESWYVDYGEKYESTKTIYKYTAKKYNNNIGLDEGYFIKYNSETNDDYIKFDAISFSDYQNQSSIFMKEFDQRFRNEGYTFETDFYYRGYSSYPGKIYKDPKSGIYIALLKVGNYTVYIFTYDDLDYLQNNIGGYSLLQGAGNAQTFDGAETGKVVLVSHGYYDGNGSFFEGVTATEEVLEYDEPLDFEGAQDKTLYKINDYGFATTKYEIEKNSEEEQGSYDYTNEVRLVHRTKIDYHINNADIIAAKYDDGKPETDDDIFTSYVEAATGKDVKVGEKIDEFYTVPEVVPTATNSCPYIFKGWYYDQDNDNDTHPVKFGTDKYAKDIYAHWIKVDNVTKDENDPTMFQDGDEDTYGGFDLAGVQIRKEMHDYNFDDVPKTPGGMRFITSLNMDIVNEINKIKPNNIEYGYVAATHKGWIDYHSKGVEQGLDEKLKYVSETANGIDTSSSNATNENYFGFAKNVNCTSKVTNSKNGVVRRDHQNFGNYLLYSFVVTYEEAGSDKGKDVLARPYIRYKDANGLERVAYSEYTGVSNVLGGCYTNYNTVAAKAGN